MRQHKKFAVGIVLENSQTEQDLTCIRNDYLSAVAGFTKFLLCGRRYRRSWLNILTES